MSDNPRPCVVHWDDWCDEWVITFSDSDQEVRVSKNSNHDQQAYNIQTAINEIIDRIAIEWI